MGNSRKCEKPYRCGCTLECMPIIVYASSKKEAYEIAFRKCRENAFVMCLCEPLEEDEEGGEG